MKNIQKLLLGCLMAFSYTTASYSQELTLKDISFMVGHWRGEGDNAPEEHWYPSQGNVMPAFFRWGAVFEMLNFVQTDTGLTFHFKHHDNKLITWEADEANTYMVKTVKDNCLFMKRISKSAKVPAGIRYCRKDEDTLEFTGKGDDESWEEAKFKLLMYKVK